MKTLDYNGRPMEFVPINVLPSRMLQLLHQGTPQVVILEPGDATRYTLLLLPLDLGDNVSAHLDSVGIPPNSCDEYLFVSALSDQLSRGEWLPFGPGRTVGTYDLVNISTNEWSREFLAWWFTELYKLL
jgi:hypothetical protein